MQVLCECSSILELVNGFKDVHSEIVSVLHPVTLEGITREHSIARTATKCAYRLMHSTRSLCLQSFICIFEHSKRQHTMSGARGRSSSGHTRAVAAAVAAAVATDLSASNSTACETCLRTNHSQRQQKQKQTTTTTTTAGLARTNSDPYDKTVPRGSANCVCASMQTTTAWRRAQSTWRSGKRISTAMAFTRHSLLTATLSSRRGSERYRVIFALEPRQYRRRIIAACSSCRHLDQAYAHQCEQLPCFRSSICPSLLTASLAQSLMLALDSHRDQVGVERLDPVHDPSYQQGSVCVPCYDRMVCDA